MPYLICENCNVYYEIEDMAEKESFTSCHCGANLVYSDSIEDYYAQFEDSEEESYDRYWISHGLTHTEKEASHAQNVIHVLEKRDPVSKNENVPLIGAGFILIGIILGIFINVSFLAFILLGLFFAISKRRSYSKVLERLKNKSWIKGLEGENIVLDYLLSLPNDYDIFHDVRLPGRIGNIDHVVIGPNGIFVIETKNLTGNYCIKGNQWYKKSKTDKYYKIRKSPGLQLLDNTIGLKIFLKNRGISTTEVHINAIVAFINRNLKIIEKTKHYNVLTPDMIPVFILNQNKVQNLEIIEKAKSELKKHTTRLFSKDAEFE